MTWRPISLEKLNELISSELLDTETPTYRLWSIIKIHPEKWIEHEYGTEGGGFWVVGILGKHVVWFNDIEGGFNISPFSNYGTIDEYEVEQFALHHVLTNINLYLNEGKKGRYFW
jgi:hypothetical protein